jgi:hypothetical protein
MAALLVTALLAAGLAARAQRVAERASLAVERGALVAEANRLATLSATVGELDLSLLLAAEGFRLADTPETRAGLRATLTEHRRAVRIGSLTPFVHDGAVADNGRTLFLGAGDRLETWPVVGRRLPAGGLDVPSEWVIRRAFDASPTEAVVAAAGSSQHGPWLRVADGDLDERLRLGSDTLGGAPFGLSFTPDGRRMAVVLASSAGRGDRSDWRLVHVDTDDGRLRETGVAGTVPAGVTRLNASFSDDGSHAVLWTTGQAAAATLVELASGRQVTLRSLGRDAVVLGYRALSSGAAELWDDGAVTLYDRTGLPGQQLTVHRAPVRDVVLAPDRTWAATVGDGSAVMLWRVDPASGIWSRPEPVTGHVGDVQEVEVDPGGGTLVTLAPGDAVIVWDVGPDAGTTSIDLGRAEPSMWLRRSCAVAGRDLTRAEWDRYLPGREYRPTCTDLG